MASIPGVGDSERRRSTAEETVTLPKKLIICCDGTWMDSDNGWVKGGLFTKGHMQNPTNVTRIARAVAPEDDAHHPQIVYYQAGIGTSIGLYSQLVGGGTGLGLAENIREAYAFLVNNYRVNDPDNLIPEDAIFLVGFSRGAFTARSIGGLLGAIGLLKKKAMPYFYQVFSDWENAGSSTYTPLFFDSYSAQDKEALKVKPSNELAHDKTRIAEYMDAYRKALLSLELTQVVDIKCIGVWDTVGALGIPVNPIFQTIFPFLPSFFHEYSWFDTGIDKCVKNAFQALALDEHRYPFSPTLWEKGPGCPTNLKQVWFPGAHSNVGGSYSDSGMADIALAWMLDQLAGNTTEHPKGFIHHDWIKFDNDYILNWYETGQKWLMDHGQSAYKGWALGHVYNSNTFPESLTGARTRTPGRYHRTFYESGKPDPNHFLTATNERMHASVRVRIERGGRPVEGDPDTKGAVTKAFDFVRDLFKAGSKPPVYDPESGPLKGWKMLDADTLAGAASSPAVNGDDNNNPARPSRVAWRWQGNTKDCPIANLELHEDLLGPYERQLLDKDPAVAQMVLKSNFVGSTPPPLNVQGVVHPKSFPR